VIASVCLVLEAGISIMRRRSIVSVEPVTRLAALFAFGGFLGFAILARCAFPYSLVILTVWPVVGVGAALETRKRGRQAWLVLAVLLFAAWLPSAGWNLMRTREIVLWAGQMDSESARAAICHGVPEGQTIGIDKYVGLFGWSLERPAVLLPWFEQGQNPPANMWLLVSDVEYRSPDQIAREEFARRPVVLETTLYPSVCPINRQLILLGPLISPP
jgi:hypothetical protein